MQTQLSRLQSFLPSLPQINLSSISSYEGVRNGRSDVNAFALLVDSQGVVERTFKNIQSNTDEKNRWLAMWKEIDIDGNNSMCLDEFIAYFNLGTTIWNERIFNLINSTCNGVVNFSQFLSFCVKYLVVDMNASINFSFKILAGPNTSVVSAKDIRLFVNQRYSLKHSISNKRAVELLQYMDNDSSGFLDLDEYSQFCMQNTTILKFTQVILSHLRRCIHGVEYWKSKSQLLNTSLMSGLHTSLVLFPSVSPNKSNEDFDHSIDTPYDTLVNEMTVRVPILELTKMNAVVSRKQRIIRSYSLCWKKALLLPTKLPGEQFYEDFPEILHAKEVRKTRTSTVQRGASKILGTLTARIHKRVFALTSEYTRGNVVLRRAFQRWKSKTDMLYSSESPINPNQQLHFLIESDSSKLQSRILNPSVIVQNIAREALSSYQRDYIIALHKDAMHPNRARRL